MILAVKCYGDLPDRPDHIPPYWPADVREIPEGAYIPEGYRIMTPEQYAEYRAAHWIETKRADQALVPVVAAAKVTARLSLWQRIVLFFLGGRS